MKKATSGLSNHSCCAGGFARAALVPTESVGRSSVAGYAGAQARHGVRVEGGRAKVGTDHPVLVEDGEGPARTVSVRDFLLDTGTVTNQRFAEFVEATGYVTDAERFRWSFVFRDHVAGAAEPRQHVLRAEWWLQVEGACWRHPDGPASSLDGLHDHPVVHVSANDAAAFAKWAGGRLPSEAEWEHAARAGRPDARFPWGDAEPDDVEVFPCNVWQGEFPGKNTAADGWERTAPALSFAPNPLGLYNLCGNVWEWTADRFRVRSLSREAKVLNEAALREDRRVLKGGSFLCHRSYCYRYRIAARIGNQPDTSTSHAGFRLAYDIWPLLERIKSAAP